MLRLDEFAFSYDNQSVILPTSLELNASTRPMENVVAVLGKNGAGKSTLFRCVTGNADYTKGKILFNDSFVRPQNVDLKASMGFLSQQQMLADWLTPRETLNYIYSIRKLSFSEAELNDWIKYWSIQGFLDKPIVSLSHGMRKRVALSICCIHDPALLILDEPFTGLDVIHLRRLEAVIKHRSNTGKLTLISTHLMHYVAKLCGKIFFLDNGRLNKFEFSSASPSSSGTSQREGNAIENNGMSHIDKIEMLENKLTGNDEESAQRIPILQH